ncbi:putative diguanylate cyclase DgcQ [Phycisphaerales bacterium]|nr:putative diguanylate cyclase DgcQ [Phycisphaerales bacterium]
MLDRASMYWAISMRRQTPVSCVMVDVDHFKAVNDTHGHHTGDLVLKQVAELLRATGRTEDAVGRYGGEEFCLILPDTDTAGAKAVAERLRASIAATPIQGVSITASLGVADNQRGRLTVEQVLQRADEALYRAKRSGRNRVELAGDPGPRSAAA